MLVRELCFLFLVSECNFHIKITYGNDNNNLFMIKHENIYQTCV